MSRRCIAAYFRRVLPSRNFHHRPVSPLHSSTDLTNSAPSTRSFWNISPLQHSNPFLPRQISRCYVTETPHSALWSDSFLEELPTFTHDDSQIELLENGYPRPRDPYVNDYAGLLHSSMSESISKQLERLRNESGIELTVVTINSSNDFPVGTRGYFESFCTALFNCWGIGNEETNDGILLLVAVKDRSVRIEIGDGYHPSKDKVVKKIINSEILPEFREGHYQEGIWFGVEAILRQFGGVETDKFAESRDTGGDAFLGLLILFGILGLFVWVGVKNMAEERAKKKNRPQEEEAQSDSKSSSSSSTTPSSHRSHQRHRSSGYRSSGGGGSSFGGGSSSGGGASGRW